MDPTFTVLLTSAIGIAFVHTLIGVDHTLPFVVLGRARGWTLRKTLGLTALCGLGHVLASVVIGGIGIAAGAALSAFAWLDHERGEIAAFLLIGFGLAYAVRGYIRSRRGRRHRHAHTHADGTVHTHDHDHQTDHIHVHEDAGSSAFTGWALFLILVFGPCEALIPLFMVPAADMSVWAVAMIVLSFAAVTIATMLGVVTIGYLGLQMRFVRRVERHAHTLAGLAIAVSGGAMLWFGHPH